MIGDYDEGYFLPHVFIPHDIGLGQNANGILDDYLDRIKFGLMTFDGAGTLLGELPLVTQTDFLTAPFPTDSVNAPGMFSYGGSKPFTFPFAVDTYMIDIGARGEPVAAGGNATEGALISVGADADITTTNATVQSTILGGPDPFPPDLRPFGATPTAGMMEDLRYYLQNNDDVIEKTADPGPGDSYYSCRTRSAILITDGLPNGDMRGPPVNCQDLGQPVGATGCPYEETETIVQEMIDDEDLDSVYVVSFLLDDPAEQAIVEAELDDLADVGGTDEAIFVSDRAELYSAISAILDELNPGSTSRTAPVATGSSPGLPHHEFFSGFNASSSAGDPWDGVLERKRTECVNGVPIEREITDADKFQEVLNDQSTAPGNVELFSAGTGVTVSGFSRNLWTVLPLDPNDIDEALAGNGVDKLNDESLLVPPAGTPTYIRDVEPAAFTTAIAETYFGVATTSERDDIVNFVHGESGSGREDERLGAIYHSTPVIVGPIVNDIQDETFNSFRRGFGYQQHPDSDPAANPPDWPLTQRPRVIYAATADGILHAFLTDDYDNTVPAEFACADSKSAGTELWGFIPPILLDNLKDLDDGGLDLFLEGNIVVRNLLDVRQIGSITAGGVKPNVWRTVLFMSLRNGGRASFALDITNPCTPEFLWQFAGDADLGETFGQPAAGQVFIDSLTYTPSGERAVILIPGGAGTVEDITTACTPVAPAIADSIEWSDLTNITPRSTRRCWCDTGSVTGDCTGGPSGRAIYVLDLITGEVIKKIGESTFPAPLNGGISVYRGSTGSIMSAAYFADADGVLWRMDFSDPDPDNWDAIALHDIFHDGSFDTAKAARSYNPPVITTDPAGNVVILHGTGNIDVLDDGTAVNKVFSLTENLTFDAVDGTLDDLAGTLNWEIALNAGELVTGPLELFNRRLFFGTYQATGADPINSCPVEGSRIWGVSYLEDPTNARNPEPELTEQDGDEVTNLDKAEIPELETTLVMGLRVAQQPDCTITQSITITDPFLGLRTLPVPTNVSSRSFRLLAHLSGGTTGSGGLSLDVLDEDLPQLVTETIISEFVESAD